MDVQNNLKPIVKTHVTGSMMAIIMPKCWWLEGGKVGPNADVGKEKRGGGGPK